MDTSLGNKHLVERIASSAARGFFTRFDLPACDTTFCVTLEPDSDSHPTDADCYSAEQIADFDNGLWCYVGVVVYPECHECGDIIMHKSASLWAVEKDLPGLEEQCREHIAEIALELADEITDTHELKEETEHNDHQ